MTSLRNDTSVRSADVGAGIVDCAKGEQQGSDKRTKQPTNFRARMCPPLNCINAQVWPIASRLKGVGNTEGPVDRVPEVDLDAFASQALGMVPVAFILQAGKHIDRFRCHQ